MDKDTKIKVLSEEAGKHLDCKICEEHYAVIEDKQLESRILPLAMKNLKSHLISKHQWSCPF